MPNPGTVILWLTQCVIDTATNCPSIVRIKNKQI